MNLENIFEETIKLKRGILILDRLEDIIEYINCNRFNSQKLSTISYYIKEII